MFLTKERAMNLKEIICCILCTAFCCSDVSSCNMDEYSFRRYINSIDGATTGCFPEFTNSPEEMEAYWTGQDLQRRPFLNEDSTWTLREDNAPANRPIIRGMRSSEDPATLLPPPDVIFIPTCGWPSGPVINPTTDMAGYPTDVVSCATFGYCPPGNETPDGYNVRCILIDRTDRDSPGPGVQDTPDIIQKYKVRYLFGFVYVRQGIAGADQDSPTTQNALDRVRDFKNSGGARNPYAGWSNSSFIQ
jgi:hypothetical protein